MMAIQNIPDISNDDAAKIANYLAANFKPDQPYDPNGRLPRELLDRQGHEIPRGHL